MAIAIFFNNKDPFPWRDALQKRLPEATIEVYPTIKIPEAVEFALCWKADAGILTNFKNLKVLQSVGASVDHILNHQTIQSDWVISRMVDTQLSQDMFEYLLAGVMMHLKNFERYHSFQKEKHWEQLPYRSMADTRITILGLGAIGQVVAQKFATLGFEVAGWARSIKKIDMVQCVSTRKDLNSVLNRTDILVNLLPLTDETKYILNEHLLVQLPVGAYLINAGRGEHLVEEDLIKLLNAKHLSGALLDVFQTEPLPKEHPFWNHASIRISPHVASLTNVQSAADLAAENYRRFKNNQPLLHIVSPKNQY